MLKLNVKKGQVIHIGTDVTVKLIQHTAEDGEVVTMLGIDAPNQVCIDRDIVRKRRLENIRQIFENALSRKP